MNIWIQRSFVFCALLLASLPAFAQSARLIWQGPAYAYAENLVIAERLVDRVIGASVGEGAQVVFFRPGDTTADTASLKEGDTLLAELPGDAYYATAVTPGVHTYVVDGTPLQVQVSPGNRHYVRIGSKHAKLQPFPSNALTFLRRSAGRPTPLLY